MKTDPLLAMLDHSRAARVGAAFFSGLCGIHDRLEKVLWQDFGSDLWGVLLKM